MLSVFAATGLNLVGIGKRDETEDIEVLRVPLTGLLPELRARQEKGDYIDIKIYGLIKLAEAALNNAPGLRLSPS